MRTGDLVAVQLEYAEYLGSWEMRTGDLVVELQYAEQSVELEDENWRLCSKELAEVAALQKDIQRDNPVRTGDFLQL